MVEGIRCSGQRLGGPNQRGRVKKKYNIKKTIKTSAGFVVGGQTLTGSSFRPFEELTWCVYFPSYRLSCVGLNRRVISFRPSRYCCTLCAPNGQHVQCIRWFLKSRVRPRAAATVWVPSLPCVLFTANSDKPREKTPSYAKRAVWWTEKVKKLGKFSRLRKKEFLEQTSSTACCLENKNSDIVCSTFVGFESWGRDDDLPFRDLNRRI